MNNTNSEINKSNLVLSNSLIDNNSDESEPITDSEDSSIIEPGEKVKTFSPATLHSFAVQ
jgi:hypothetical protein